MDRTNKLSRFLEAQNHSYLKALSEIRNGKKESHWMWYIFPQLEGLGKSKMADYYAIADLEEAQAYLAHPVLGRHLVKISGALLELHEKSALEIFGTPDDLKLKSCMTLFASLENTNGVFAEVLDRYYGGGRDRLTLELLDRYQDDKRNVKQF